MTNGKIAVTYENGLVFQHFGHTAQFKLYTVQDGKIVSSEVLDTNGSGHGALAGWLKAHSVTALICGGIGGGARTALAEAGIRAVPGCGGSTDEQAAALLARVLCASILPPPASSRRRRRSQMRRSRLRGSPPRGSRLRGHCGH